jgi:hypothetical protein
MNRTELAQLRGPREYPAVTLLSPLQRNRPGNSEDPVRLRHLVDQARRRLQGEFGVRDSASVLCHLEEGIEAIGLAHASDGVAVFATRTRGDTLLVEDNFEYRRASWTVASSPQAPSTRLSALGIHGPVAMLLRYSSAGQGD